MARSESSKAARYDGEVAGLNSIPDRLVFLALCGAAFVVALLTALARSKWSMKDKVITMKLKLKFEYRSAWLATAPLAAFSGWKLLNVAGSG